MRKVHFGLMGLFFVSRSVAELSRSYVSPLIMVVVMTLLSSAHVGCAKAVSQGKKKAAVAAKSSPACVENSGEQDDGSCASTQGSLDALGNGLGSDLETASAGVEEPQAQDLGELSGSGQNDSTTEHGSPDEATVDPDLVKEIAQSLLSQFGDRFTLEEALALAQILAERARKSDGIASIVDGAEGVTLSDQDGLGSTDSGMAGADDPDGSLNTDEQHSVTGDADSIVDGAAAGSGEATGEPSGSGNGDGSVASTDGAGGLNAEEYVTSDGAGTDGSAPQVVFSGMGMVCYDNDPAALDASYVYSDGEWEHWLSIQWEWNGMFCISM